MLPEQNIKLGKLVPLTETDWVRLCDLVQNQHGSVTRIRRAEILLQSVKQRPSINFHQIANSFNVTDQFEH
jgi:hypothetical protein